MSIRLIDVLEAGLLDSSGRALDNGTVTVYDAGTTNLRTVYSDFDLTTPLSNPLTLDANGKATAYTNHRVKLLIKTSGGATVETLDDVGAEASDLATASADDLAGDGLTAPGDGTLAVNPDLSLEISATGALGVKAGGNASEAADLWNCTLAASVASSALTITLKTRAGADPSETTPVTIGFRATTATDGTYSSVKATAATSVTVSSGSTLGHVSAAAWPIYVYAINNAGTIELAVSTSIFDERYVRTSTTEGALGGADSPILMYSTTGRSGVAVRLIGILISTQATAGTWAAVPTSIAFPLMAAPAARTPVRVAGTAVGVGGIWRSASTGTFNGTTSADVTNTSIANVMTNGRPVTVRFGPDGGATKASIAITGGGGASDGELQLLRDATVIARAADPGGTDVTRFFELTATDVVAAGTYTYKAKWVRTGGTPTIDVVNCRLEVFEE